MGGAGKKISGVIGPRTVSEGLHSIRKVRASTKQSAPIFMERQLNSPPLAVRAGYGTRHYKLVKVDGPDDLVFQSVRAGKPMSDQNILRRHIKPAAQKIGLGFVTWRCLRTSHATWLVQCGADAKSVQGQMRHSRISTTMDVYAQIVPAAQRQALAKLAEFAKPAPKLVPNLVPLLVQ
jgi:integrase